MQLESTQSPCDGNSAKSCGLQHRRLDRCFCMCHVPFKCKCNRCSCSPCHISKDASKSGMSRISLCKQNTSSNALQRHRCRLVSYISLPSGLRHNHVPFAYVACMHSRKGDSASGLCGSDILTTCSKLLQTTAALQQHHSIINVQCHIGNMHQSSASEACRGRRFCGKPISLVCAAQRCGIAETSQ